MCVHLDRLACFCISPPLQDSVREVLVSVVLIRWVFCCVFFFFFGRCSARVKRYSIFCTLIYTKGMKELAGLHLKLTHEILRITVLISPHMTKIQTHDCMDPRD